MKKNEVCMKVAEILQSVFEENIEVPLDYDDDIRNLLDSIQFVTLIVELESKFKIAITDEDFEIEKMCNIDKIADLIMSYIDK